MLFNHFSITQAVDISRAIGLQILMVQAAILAVAAHGVGALLDRYEPRRLTTIPTIACGIVRWLLWKVALWLPESTHPASEQHMGLCV